MTITQDAAPTTDWQYVTMSESGPGDPLTMVRVLIVEDSEDQAALLRQYFERAGCLVTTVATAEAAITTYRADPPDLAVIDLLLPGMGGEELSTRLRADLPGCRIAITSVFVPRSARRCRGGEPHDPRHRRDRGRRP
jgi:CheY-like chemotaxis protein